MVTYCAKCEYDSKGQVPATGILYTADDSGRLKKANAIVCDACFDIIFRDPKAYELTNPGPYFLLPLQD